MTAAQAEQDKLYSVGTLVPDKVRIRVKVLAAKQNLTMSKIVDKAFRIGLEILEQQQRDIEEQEEAEEAAEA